jgi:uncharacterized membrane protein
MTASWRCSRPAKWLPTPLLLIRRSAPSRASDKLPKSSKPRTVARLVVGLALSGFGVAHLTIARKPFRAQVPERLAEALPVSTDDIVLGSGIIEIGLGAALVALSKERLRIGAALAAYFVAIFPGNVSQLLKHADAFGLDTDSPEAAKRGSSPWPVRQGTRQGDVTPDSRQPQELLPNPATRLMTVANTTAPSK